MHQPASDRWRVPCVCVVLAAITWLVFGRVLQAEFLNYDDPLYVTANPLVMHGLAPRAIAHVFIHFESRFYSPLTMVSHMADSQFYESWAGGHHLTNLLLHTVTALLLFLMLWRMTGETWRAAFVAAVFAIHPLHVESVAWISERNDLLAGLFFVLTLWAYLFYSRKPSPGRYLLVVAGFILGLLSKPTVVTLPFIFLLLDFWPLRRNSEAKTPVSRLILEKVPFLVFSIGAGIAAYLAEGKSVASLEAYSIPARLSNAVVACIIYLRQMFWPSGLSIFYPRPVDGWSMPEVAGALAILLCISAAAFLLRKKRPYFLVGWLWYLVMLAPVIGIVQVGEFAHADRYAYLSQIGLYIALAWGIGDLRLPAPVTGAAAALALGALAFCAQVQAGYWHDSESIFRHAIESTDGNYVAYNNLGSALQAKGDVDGAIACYHKGLESREASSSLHDNLGRALFEKGDVPGALKEYYRALEIDPQSFNVRYNLGNAFASLAWKKATSMDDSVRNGADAVKLAEQARDLTGGADPNVLRALGAAYAEAGRFPEAMAVAQQAAEIAVSRGHAALAEELRREAESYRSGMPLRATTP